MTTPVNPTTASWTNPTTGLDQAGNSVPWDPTTDLAGVEIEFDGAAAVSVPLALGADSFDLTSLTAYTALPAGSHALAISIVTLEGAVSPLTASVPFLVAVAPLAPTNLVVA